MAFVLWLRWLRLCAGFVSCFCVWGEGVHALLLWFGCVCFDFALTLFLHVHIGLGCVSEASMHSGLGCSVLLLWVYFVCCFCGFAPDIAFMRFRL